MDQHFLKMAVSTLKKLAQDTELGLSIMAVQRKD
jgi:hypothetical protein